jgi:hypothetical protein
MFEFESSSPYFLLQLFIMHIILKLTLPQLQFLPYDSFFPSSNFLALHLWSFL